MPRPIRALIALGAATAVLAVTGCSTSASTEFKESISLPQQWERSSVKWAVDGDVHSVVALPEHIAYAVKADGADRFVILDNKGKSRANLTQPKELKDDYEVIVDTAKVDGKTYVAVWQEGSLSKEEISARKSNSNYASVVTGFDEDGKQLFQRVYTTISASSTMKIDPVTGAPFIEQKNVIKSGKQYMSQELVDGVTVELVADGNDGKMYVNGGSWQREVKPSVFISEVGGYVRITNVVGRSYSAPASDGFCLLLDPHTGKTIDEGNSKLGESCADVTVSGDALIVQSTGDIVKGDIGVVAPKQNKSRVFTPEEQFTPYSVDADGTIYGVTNSKDGTVPATASFDAKESPQRIEGAVRTPAFITKNGIAAFSVDSAEGVQGRMVFAVAR